MPDYIHSKFLIFVIFFLISLCTALAQKYSFRDAFIAFNDTFLIGCKKKRKNGKKINKIYIITYLLLRITKTKSYKLNTTIIYTKMTNNDDIKQF